MAKLVVTHDGKMLREVILNQTRTTVGRRPHNDVVIENLAVSGEHAVIVRAADGEYVEDLNSTNGTVVNGQSVKRHRLSHNDVLEMGKYKIRYVNELLSAAQSPPLVKNILPTATTPPAPYTVRDETPTVLGVPSQMAHHAWNTPSSFEPGSVQSNQPEQPTFSAPLSTPSYMISASLRIANGASEGKVMALVKPVTTLGRAGAQVAQIARMVSGYTISHVEGLQYPLVNKRPIGAHPYALQHKDVIEIAGTQLEFLLG